MSDALKQEGIGVFERGDFSAACAVFEKADESFQNLDAEVSNYLAFLHHHLGNRERAEQYAHRALTDAKPNADFLANAALIFSQSENWKEAEAAARRALEMKTDHPLAADFLGRALVGQNRGEEAIPYFLQADTQIPMQADSHYRLGTAYYLAGRHEEAERSFASALEMDNQFSRAWLNRGANARAQGKYGDARNYFAKAVELAPDWPEAHVDHGTSLLLAGNFEEGLKEFEWRLKMERPVQRVVQSQPRWNGESFIGKKLLLCAEQGFGDSFLLSRYIPLVKARGGEVWVAVPEPLRRFFEKLPGVDRVVEWTEQISEADLQFPMFSLPYLFQTKVETIPIPIALRTEKNIPNQGKRVGLVWRGFTGRLDNDVRSLPFSKVLELIKTESSPGIHWINLQKDIHPEEIKAFQKLGIEVNVEWMGKDFCDYAQAISSCDLVLTVDTAAAHLAGTLGKQTWVMLARPHDWRWFLERKDSPWYLNTTLFRQLTCEDWDTVLGEVHEELEKFMTNEQKSV